MDTAYETTSRTRSRLGTWLFLPCSALTVAAMRLQGASGDRRRAECMHDLMAAFIRGAVIMFVHSRSGDIAGAAMRGPDGDIVAVYYGPGDTRNTKLDWEGYSLQHRVVETEELLPLHHRRSSNDLHLDAYMPAAARDTRRNQ